jgi:Tol biopolymer transport system component
MRANQLILIAVFLVLSISACSPAPSIQPIATPVPTELSTATPTSQSTPTLSPTAIPSPTATLTPTVSLAINPYGIVSRIPSPDGRWTAVLDTRVGSLDLQRADGKTFAVFASGSTVETVSWSPDSRKIVAVRTNYILPQPDSNSGVIPGGPLQVWRVENGAEKPDVPSLLYQTPDPCTNCPAPLQIDLGHWSPNSRYVLFWLGPLSESIQADGVPLFALDVETGKATPLTNDALLNPRYQSWSPDSSALAFTAGGDRSAQTNKWLDLFDVATGQVTTVISKTEAIPGIVAWSPRGDWIAYAAVRASDSSDNWYYMGFDNPAILKRRVYLLNPKTREHHRLNQVDAFQDAPMWSDDGAVLYCIQREGNDMVLMAANPSTGQAQVIEGSRRPAPTGVGYYGQSNWDDLLAYRFASSSTPVPPLNQIYTDPVSGFTLRYPSGWHIGKGWETMLYRCDECTTISSDGTDAAQPDLNPFSGRAFISIQVIASPGTDLDALLSRVLANPGPGQYVGFSAPLTVFDKRNVTMDGQPALRLEIMDESGTTNHALIVTDGKHALVVRGRGDNRVFDAIVASLQWR